MRRKLGVSIRTAVSVLVNNGTSFERGVASRLGLGPDIHSHTSRLAIRRGSEIGIVSARAILSIENDKIVAFTTLAVVVNLEVASFLRKSEHIVQIMYHVGRVEQLCNRCIDI